MGGGNARGHRATHSNPDHPSPNLKLNRLYKAIGLITMRLGGGGIGGPELPSLALFLTCLNGSDSLVAQAPIRTNPSHHHTNEGESEGEGEG